MWLRRWLWVGGGISLLGGLLWLLVEHDLGLHALVRSAGWAIVVWVECGLIWIGLQYGQEYEESRAYLRIRSEHRADGYGQLLRVRHSYVPGVLLGGRRETLHHPRGERPRDARDPLLA